jgi:hypothetical protein
MVTPAPGRVPVGRVEVGVDGQSVVERLARGAAVAERLDDVAHHRVVAVDVGLVRHRIDPAGVGIGLLAEIAGRPLDERPERAVAHVLDDPPRVPVQLEATLQAALRRP